MNNILQRALTGALFVSFIIGALWFGNKSSFIVITLFFVLGIFEYIRLFKESSEIEISSSLTISVCIVIYLIVNLAITSIIPGDFTLLLLFILPILFLMFLSELWRKKKNPIINIGVMSFPLFYLVIPFSLILYLNQISSHENPLVIGMFLLIWTNDTFAYLSGRFFGKTKLFERISPKKTWEGTIGGIVFTLLVGYLIGMWGNHNSSAFWMISALIIAPCSIFGDLLESLFKRSLNIKDSGTILPGHGGILDRFDATLFTVPFFFTWVLLYN